MGSGGAGVLSLFNYQGTSRIAMVVEQINRKTPTGMFLLQYIEDIVLDAGLYGPLWNLPFGHISKYTSTHSLIFHTFQCNYENHIHRITRKARTPTWRWQILNKTHQKTFSATKDKPSVQKVRSKLEVIHVSDVSSIDGRNMNESFLSPQHGKSARNNYDWPSKHRITNTDLAAWMKLLKHIYIELKIITY